MAENPNDKALRDKLLSAEYAYDPGAWAAMEQLMDRKKRRGLLWWWLSAGAVSIALLVSAGVYYASIRSVPEHKLARTSAPSIVSTTTQSVAEVDLKAPSKDGSSNTTDASRRPNENSTSAAAQQQNLSGTSTHTGASLSNAAPLRSTFTRQTGSKKSGLSDRIQDSKEDQSTFAPGLYADDLMHNRGSLLYENKDKAELDPDGAPTASIPAHHKHKILVSYALGAESGIFASYTRKTFGATPTWTAGISQQLHIGKYLAITNSILYSEVNFKIDHPAYPDNQYNDLISFTSQIKEIAIPLGVKIYPYTSRHIRLSAGISYVNHIKMSEKFAYQLSPKSPPATFVPVAVADFPGVNSFEPGKAVANLNIASSPATTGQLMEYYSLGNGRRYYASMMYTIGVDILLPHRISISAEPAMRMSLAPIRMQHSRVFDFGANATIRYTF
ncbi:MAG: hypothetical protein JST83_06280 [Bacteroidetes bacterium]|nr:hypothetical protein [Bacteroidota bacterium]